MRFMLFLHADETDVAPAPPEHLTDYLDRIHAWQEELTAAGAFVASGQFAPSSEAATLHPGEDGPALAEGTAHEGPVQISGYFIIDAADRAEAERWARRCPTAQWNRVEIRPLLDLAET
jgi:hypothetical protein